MVDLPRIKTLRGTYADALEFWGASQTKGGAGNFTLQNTGPHSYGGFSIGYDLEIQCDGNETARTFTITGTLLDGSSKVVSKAGLNNDTISVTEVWRGLTTIAIDGATTSTVQFNRGPAIGFSSGGGYIYSINIYASSADLNNSILGIYPIYDSGAASILGTWEVASPYLNIAQISGLGRWKSAKPLYIPSSIAFINGYGNTNVQIVVEYI